MQALTTAGGVIRYHEGKQLNVLGHAITASFTNHNAQGSYYLFEVITPPGRGVPLHVHEWEDELMYMVEGELEIRLGDQQFVVSPGDHVFFPRYLAHAFQNAGSKASKAIFTVVLGASFEAFFDQLAALPPGEPDLANVTKIFAEHGMTILLLQPPT